MVVQSRIQVLGKRHSSRKAENEFGRYLANALGTELTDQNCPLEKSALDMSVLRSDLFKSLSADNLLRAKKRQQCLEALDKLPEKLFVTDCISRISCDFVVLRGQERFYWEFHEKQHRTLSVSRPKSVYGPAIQKFEVPRYLQRLIRDVWRIKALPNFTIVWDDWFAFNRPAFVPSLSKGFHEHYLPGSFSFGTFALPDNDARNTSP